MAKLFNNKFIVPKFQPQYDTGPLTQDEYLLQSEKHHDLEFLIINQSQVDEPEVDDISDGDNDSDIEKSHVSDPLKSYKTEKQFYDEELENFEAEQENDAQAEQEIGEQAELKNVSQVEMEQKNILKSDNNNMVETMDQDFNYWD